MFDSYCLNLNPLMDAEITTADQLHTLVSRIEAHLELPKGIFLTRLPSGQPVKAWGGHSISMLRTAIIHHAPLSVKRGEICRALGLGVRRDTVWYHRKQALQLFKHKNDEFMSYYELVKTLAA